MTKKLVTLGFAELTAHDDRVFATLTPQGEAHIKAILARPKRGSASKVKAVRLGDLPPEYQAAVLAQLDAGRADAAERWAREHPKFVRKSDDVGAPPYTHPASRDEKP